MRALYIIFLFLLALLSSPLLAQGLQGPFQPIGVETVHTNGNASDVSMLYKATTTGGQDVYSSGTVSMTEAQVIEQAFNKMDDPNGGGVKDRFEDDGWDFEPPSGGGSPAPIKVVEQPDEFEGIEGYCGAPSNPSDLMGCKDDTDGYTNYCVDENDTSCFEFDGFRCHIDGSNKVELRYRHTPAFGNPTVSSRQHWFAPVSFTLCSDAPGDFLPDPSDPEPEPDEFRKYMSGDPAPEPNPQAPNPRPDGFPPPMMDPDFYREPSSQQFYMQLPSTPTPQQLSDQMTADYASWTSTAAPASNPLPTGMSYQAPPSGGSGSYGSPLSGYGAGGVNGDGSQIGSGGSTGGGSSGGGGDVEVTVEVSSQCEDYPDSLGCVDTNVGDEIVPDIEPSIFDAGVGLTSISLSSASGCPAPISMDFMGQPYDIEYTILCDYGSSVSPLILLFASFSAGMIMLGVRRSG